jgi:hypothetical protein
MRLGIAAFRCRDGTIGWPPRGQRLYLYSSAARLSPCYCVNRAHLWISNAAEPPTAHGRDIIAVKPAQRSELLLTACRLTTAVQAIVSRNISICGHRTVLSVTTIQVGFRGAVLRGRFRMFSRLHQRWSRLLACLVADMACQGRFPRVVTPRYQSSAPTTFAFFAPQDDEKLGSMHCRNQQ